MTLNTLRHPITDLVHPLYEPGLSIIYGPDSSHYFTNAATNITSLYGFENGESSINELAALLKSATTNAFVKSAHSERLHLNTIGQTQLIEDRVEPLPEAFHNYVVKAVNVDRVREAVGWLVHSSLNGYALTKGKLSCPPHSSFEVGGKVLGGLDEQTEDQYELIANVESAFRHRTVVDIAGSTMMWHLVGTDPIKIGKIYSGDIVPNNFNFRSRKPLFDAVIPESSKHPEMEVKVYREIFALILASKLPKSKHEEYLAITGEERGLKAMETGSKTTEFFTDIYQKEDDNPETRTGAILPTYGCVMLRMYNPYSVVNANAKI